MTYVYMIIRACLRIMLHALALNDFDPGCHCEVGALLG